MLNGIRFTFSLFHSHIRCYHRFECVCISYSPLRTRNTDFDIWHTHKQTRFMISAIRNSWFYHHIFVYSVCFSPTTLRMDTMAWIDLCMRAFLCMDVRVPKKERERARRRARERATQQSLAVV